MKGKTLDHKCPACRAVIKWNEKIEKFKCDYCSNIYTLEQLKHFENASSNINNDGIKGDDTQYDAYKCNNCGAEIIADKQTSATFCVYCGNTAIMKNKLSGKFAPSYIIPFKKSKELAIEKFVNLKKGRPLVPKEFVNSKNIEKIRGVYIPFRLFNIKVEGDIEILAKKIFTSIVGNKTYQKTSTYKLIRGGDIIFEQIPIDSSTRFDNNIMSTLEPFDFKELKEYNHAYLSGFLAEMYDIEEQELFKEVSERAKKTASDELLNSAIGYNTKVIESSNLTCFCEKVDYVLLPVWMVNVRYNDKMHIFAMNGQTGEFIGDIPVDYKTGLLIFILSFVICFIIVFLIAWILSGGSM